jgi:hypothetical protein
MFRMSHLGPHTFVAHDCHHRGDQWLKHFGRVERHHLVEEDRTARNTVALVLCGAMFTGLALMALTLWRYV